MSSSPIEAHGRKIAGLRGQMQLLKDMQHAAEALRRIGDVYAIKARIRGRPAEQRVAICQTETKPLMGALCVAARNDNWPDAQSRGTF